jgi:hypothetical protein
VRHTDLDEAATSVDLVGGGRGGEEGEQEDEEDGETAGIHR